MTWYFILSLSILPAFLIGLVRFQVVDKAYRPFLGYVFLSLLNEIVIHFLPAQPKKYQLADLNLFALLEFLLLLWQFRRWQIFRGFSGLYYGLLAAFCAGWLLENLVYSRITAYNPYFMLLHCFLIVLLSINGINGVVIQVFEPIYRNAQFILCIGLILFFTYYMILSALFLNSSRVLAMHFFNIQVYINIVSNLLFAVGVYFIPARPREIVFLKPGMRSGSERVG